MVSFTCIAYNHVMEILLSFDGDISSVVDDYCRQAGLTCKEMSLKSKPGSLHWHMQKPGSAGTLEATFCKGELTIAVRANRRGAWTDDAAESLAVMLRNY